MSAHTTTVDWDKGPKASCTCGWMRRASSSGSGDNYTSGYPECHRMANEHEDRMRAALAGAAVPGQDET